MVVGAETMAVYLGSYRDTEVECEVECIDGVAGRVKCFECGGDGDWTKFHPDPCADPIPCVECKGTGFILVSI